MFKESYGVLDRKRGALLKKIASTGPFIMGASACWMNVRCGNPRCKCAKSKEFRHRKLQLSWTTKERHGSQYIPVDLYEEVQAWIENYWIIRDYMKEMSKISSRMIKIYSRSKPKQSTGKPR